MSRDRKSLLDSLGARIVWVTCYPAVVIASLYGGWLAGLSSAVASCLIAILTWPPFIDHPFIMDRGDWLGLSAFLFNSAMIAGVAEKPMDAAVSGTLERHVDRFQYNVIGHALQSCSGVPKQGYAA